MMKIEKLTVKYHDVLVGTLSLTPDDRLCAFEYDRQWLADGFSISPLELPLKQGLFVAKPYRSMVVSAFLRIPCLTGMAESSA